MMTTRTWLWAAAVLLVAGCSKEPALESGSPEPLQELSTEAPAAPAQVEVRPEDPLQPVAVTLTPTLALFPSGAQSVREVDHVGLHLGVIGAVGTHQVAVTFLTPSGATYQFEEQAVNGAANDEVAADFSLPVAGTVIDAHNLEGVWTAKVFFDGEAHSEQTFELAP